MTKRIRMIVPALLSLLLALTVTVAASQDQRTGSASDPSLSETQHAAPAKGPSQMTGFFDDTLRIPSAAFIPRKYNVWWRPSASGGCLYAESGDRGTWWHAPVYLPPGATIWRLWLSVIDSNPDHDAQASLTAYDSYGTVLYKWDFSTAGSAGFQFPIKYVPDHVVESGNRYVASWRPLALGDSIQLCGFVIDYR